MAVKICQNCHGNKTVVVWSKDLKKYVRITCPGCNGKGYIDTSTI